MTPDSVAERALTGGRSVYSLLAGRLASATLDTLGGHELG